MSLSRRQFISTCAVTVAALPLLGKVASSTPCPESSCTVYNDAGNRVIVPSKELAAKYGLKVTDSPCFRRGDQLIAVTTRRTPFFIPASTEWHPTLSGLSLAIHTSLWNHSFDIGDALQYARDNLGWNTIYVVIMCPNMNDELKIDRWNVFVRGATA